MIRLTTDQVLKMHKALIEKTGGAEGLLSEPMLLSALNEKDALKFIQECKKQ